MYARGINTSDIGASLQEQYDVEISPEYVCTITYSIFDDIQA